MLPTTTTRVAIIGAGASGSLLAVQLCRQAGSQKLEILLFDTAQTPGPGLAYSTSDPLHLLNVPAGRMSALPDLPDHFVSWLNKNRYYYLKTDFVPRGLYGNYLEALFQETIRQCSGQVSVRHIRQEITALSQSGGAVELRAANGVVFPADKVVLALGNFPPGHPCVALNQLPAQAPYFANPWNPELLNKLPESGTVLLIGTGLTMVDMLMSLHRRKFSGKVLAVSTHGHLPTAHQETEPYHGVTAEIANVACVNHWLGYIRQHVQLAQKKGLNWRAVIDAFRPYSQAFWLQLSLAEKRRFMRHLRHIWAVSRHRMPPQSAAVVQEMLARKSLTVKAGRVLKTTFEQGRIKAEIGQNHNPETETLFAGLVVNCTGPEADFRKVNSALLANLLQTGQATTDALHMGFAALPDGRLLNARHEPSDLLFTLGPPLKGVLWESTAIPEIREQAFKLPLLLLQKSHI